MIKLFLFALVLVLGFTSTSFSQNSSGLNQPLISQNKPDKPDKSNKALVEGKVAFIDLQTLDTNILEIKKQYDKVQQEFQASFNELKNLDEQLVKLQEELKSNALNEKIYRDKLNLFQTLKKNLDIKAEYYKQSSQARLEQYLAPIRDKVFKSLQVYAKQKGIIAVFSLPDSNNLIFYDDSNNITEDFIKDYNLHSLEK
ncbi:MAG: OmpH family outer membrane protein [Acidobacteria bacterium]|nr:OmpH family outer membrane protein [Acidobacteriota bacterium]